MKSLITGDDSAFDLSCPHCHSRMAKVEAAGVTVDRCTECGGIWLDYKELDRGLQSGKKKLAKVDTGGKRDGKGAHMLRYCPRDKALMVTMVDGNQTHVEFEQCTICGGMFLDAGELKDLAEFTISERIKSLLGR